MDKVRYRIPTRQETAMLFVAVVFPIHVWAVLMFLYEVPAYMRRMSVWDMVGIFAYTQAFALIESIIVLGALIFVCIALPRRLFKDRFIAQGTIFMLVIFLWIIPVHYQTQILDALNWNMSLYQVLVVIWLITLFGAIIGLSLLIRRNKKVEQGVIRFVEKLAVLSAPYVFIGVISIFIIILRNIF